MNRSQRMLRARLPVRSGANAMTLLLGTLLVLIPAAPTPAQEESVAFIHATVIDGVSSTSIGDATVLISNGKITGLVSGKMTLPAGTRIVNLRGKHVMPGLIDAHVHIESFPAAKVALMSGITTARSMGVAHFADVGLRELARAGQIDAPEILAAGYHIHPPPDDAFFLDFPEMSDLMTAGVKGPEALRRMAQAMAHRQVDWIKTNATARAGVPTTDPRQPYFSEAELVALVDVGKRNGIPIAAHAHGDEGGRSAVLAGVRSIEHGTYLSRDTLRIMADRGTYLVPTVSVVRDLAEPGGDYDDPTLLVRGRQMYPQIKQTVRAANELGVKIVAGTDSAYRSNSTLRMSQELLELVEIGLTPLEAIQSATTAAAELLQIEDRTGRIVVGHEADLIIMDGNPLEDISALHDLLMVVNNGKIVLDRLSR
jgi:imidazolonepropionase-like amidohydrolase